MKSFGETTRGMLRRWLRTGFMQQLLVILAVFGPATITAMADNDASGVATYSIAGAQLGTPSCSCC